ncbi:MAG TPA: NfeD family protein [Verrucomicrobiota bacterium]|jgi:membrane protein implicated in regulation of membrane protease activity|nr:NfeD family protein [Verrucomicrobiota bacterium]HQL80142.1 NfeD family protein [Verrucomicrobiota bacterium]
MDFFVYSVCFGVGLLFAIVSAFLGHLFGGHDMDTDVGTGGHAEAGFQDTGMPGLSPFSPTTITAFITAFGGLGMIFSRIKATESPWISAPLALLGALAIAAGVVWLFGTVFHKVDASSESRVATLAGMTATVITPIPANGVGEIAYVQAGSRYTAPARDEQGTPVSSGQTVRIVRIVGTQFYVTPV